MVFQVLDKAMSIVRRGRLAAVVAGHSLSVMATTQLEAVTRESSAGQQTYIQAWRRRRLGAGPGWRVRVIEPRLDPALPVLFLLAKHLPHQGSFALVVQRARLTVRLIAGAARRRCPLTHGQTLLTAGPALRASSHHCRATGQGSLLDAGHGCGW
jgi:hypothetical protein